MPAPGRATLMIAQKGEEHDWDVAESQADPAAWMAYPWGVTGSARHFLFFILIYPLKRLKACPSREVWKSQSINPRSRTWFPILMKY